ncbi:MAG: hypothetical protein Q8P61_09435 [Candidatus Nanopelagicales bacterium]|nr:hypothetical protein [Candidatus Nanopelagicales bacterium]
MTNPSPRPALRKAPDAHIHPALALGAVTLIDLREPDSAAIQVELAVPPAPIETNSPHDAPADRAKEDRKKRTAKGAKNSKKQKNKKAVKAGKKAKKKGKKRQLADRIDVRREIPPTVRRQLRTGAKARGTSVDEVVTSVLEGWSPS